MKIGTVKAWNPANGWGFISGDDGDDYFFNFDDGFWPELSVGDAIGSVKGAVHYYFGEYVIYLKL